MTAASWARWLLRHLAPPGGIEDLLGDLEEIHRRRRDRHGRAVAALLTSLEAVDMSLSLVRHRVRRRVRATVAGARGPRVPVVVGG